jgi:alpha-D-ribose 1-methylphosphonate 5-triphosphate diphosphatase
VSGLGSDLDDRGDERSLTLQDARVVMPDAVVEGGLRVAGDRIEAVGPDLQAGTSESASDPKGRGSATGGPADRVVDVGGRLVVPGLVDLHGDSIEDHLFPRDGVRMRTPVAMETADRENVAAGVTTKFHAISFMNSATRNRSPELGREIAAAIDDGPDGDSPSLAADHRLHARCELTESDAVETVEELVEAGAVDLVSVMTHIPGEGQFRNYDGFDDWYDGRDLPREQARERYERKTSTTAAAIERGAERVIEFARAAGVPVATHDDVDRETLERRQDLGADIAEYPVTLDAAETAVGLEMTTAMGAPNLVQGGSQRGNLRTADAIDAGVVDVLCSDYHPPSLLLAPFVETGEPLPDRIRRVTAGPADAVGLTDRGRIEPGKRADLAVVEPDPVPRVTRVFVGGREVCRHGER